MRCGDRNGFLVFYNKTFQYAYLWTMKTMEDQLRRNSFLEEFYPYALLHISDLDQESQVFPWLSRMLPAFYQVWSGVPWRPLDRPGRPDPPGDEEFRLLARMIWESIEERVQFPPRSVRQRIPLPFVIAGFVSVLVLLACVIWLNHNRRVSSTADQEAIDRINSENMSYEALEEGGGLDGIDGLYTETTTVTEYKGGEDEPAE